ncbi:MAG: PadR family transcriptional regulator [Acidobacteriota bacterium]|nr:PadR family transcriptional regulator [Acidobacteriota bacterium]
MNRTRFWGGPRGERIFHKGDFKYLILDLLKEKPRHGYEIIRELEERFGGFYAPSPGAVYPTLQWLEEMGYVTVVAQDGKKTYTITESGLGFLVEKEKETEEVKKQMKSWWGNWSSEFRDEMREVMRLLGDMGRMIGQKTRQTGQEKLPQVKTVLSNAFKEIEGIFKG